jgi:hypothetical protein
MMSTKRSRSVLTPRKRDRRRELLRITADNQAILKRIQVRKLSHSVECNAMCHLSPTKLMFLYQERQPFYNHLEWERERLQNEKYLRNISQVTCNTTVLIPRANCCVHRVMVGVLLISFCVDSVS